MAASNRQEDRAGAHKLITPLLNRFIHLDLDVSNDDWQSWAAQTGVSPEVRSFLNFRPNLLFNFEPGKGDRAFPTPRSWSFVSDVLGTLPADLLHPIIAGCVGDGPAAEFVGFVQVYRKLPDVDQVLAKPTTAPVPKGEPSVLFALAGAIAEKCRTADNTLRNNAVTYMLRLPDEFAILTMRDALACTMTKGKQSPMLTLPKTNDFVKKHKELFVTAKGAA